MAATAATVVVVGGTVVAPASAREAQAHGDPVQLVGPVSVASDINDRGVTVGWFAADWESELHAFRRSSRGRVVDLGPGLARAVNESGVVAGERLDAGFEHHATWWGVDGRAHDIGAGADSWVNDINDRGVVVGYGRVELGYRAFAARVGRPLVPLPHPAGMEDHQGVARAVNEQGDIAGYLVSPAGDTVPVVWRGRRHTPTLLPASGRYHDVTGINERGTVLGTAVGDGGYRVVVWTGRDHRQVDITAPGEHALSTAINDRGQIAGRFADASGAFRWDPSTGRRTDLRGLSPEGGGQPLAMNNRGCVVGESLQPDTGTSATLFAPC